MGALGPEPPQRIGAAPERPPRQRRRMRRRQDRASASGRDGKGSRGADVGRRPEHRLERGAQRGVDLGEGRGAAEVGEARHPVMRLGDAAGDDAGEMA